MTWYARVKFIQVFSFDPIHIFSGLTGILIIAICLNTHPFSYDCFLYLTFPIGWAWLINKITWLLVVRNREKITSNFGRFTFWQKTLSLHKHCERFEACAYWIIALNTISVILFIIDLTLF
ncbi:hypothetical protein ACFLZY_00495 [Patescibacteria group bacterium]